MRCSRGLRSHVLYQGRDIIGAVGQVRKVPATESVKFPSTALSARPPGGRELDHPFEPFACIRNPASGVSRGQITLHQSIGTSRPVMGGWSRAMPANPIRSSVAPIVAIIDDDEAVREALSDFLFALDLSCRTFDRAEAFMAEYAPGSFDCLITDVSMPGRSGLDLLQHLRSIDSSMPVIIITGDPNPTIRSRADRGGANACLTKPVSSDALFRHLQSVLSQAGSDSGGGRPENPSDG